ncbi:Glutamine transport ATP-binding protein GlnQ [Candidatus Arcanobacter lacustris]|uniref:Glutamine transport ATP-binding protein GlnQ n=1 Tax=Candidatus Arcanibacter lacustris TaxID=1607817 RepID=A0A0F5MQ03_9RICK|nr:Glutamine transport ATP-binding protein GlnQ [Candidatus Arcanobacter lacustris]
MKSYISISNLNKSFASNHVLSGVNLEIAGGDAIVIIGGSGTGKSVLIKTIAGLIEPDSGSIKIDGMEVNNISNTNYRNLTKKFGFLFQGGALFDSLTVWENIAFALVNNKLKTKAQAKEIAFDKLSKVGLSNNIGMLYPSELSGGMQKRVALARAISTEPEILFFDEPTTGLDPIMANVINDLIVRCSEELKATTITITHDMNSVKQIAKRVAMIHKGNIIWDGKIDNLFSSDNEFVDQFVHGNIAGPL